MPVKEGLRQTWTHFRAISWPRRRHSPGGHEYRQFKRFHDCFEQIKPPATQPDSFMLLPFSAILPR